jgi:hypothetical protein
MLMTSARLLVALGLAVLSALPAAAQSDDRVIHRASRLS